MRSGWALLLLLAGCAKPALEVLPLPPPVHALGYHETAAAARDGRLQHRPRPAKGDVYQISQLTATHRALPVGSRVAVENLLNGRAVEVRIIGRGSPEGRSTLELSSAAAGALGALGSGKVPVRLRIIALPGSAPDPGSGRFTLRVASFTSEYRAAVLKGLLRPTWAGAHVQQAEAAGQTFYRVGVGPFASRREARRVALSLAAAGYPVIVLEE